MNPARVPQPTGHRALMLLYLGGGALTAMVGGVLIFAVQPSSRFSDTLPFDRVVGLCLFPFGLLALLGGLAMLRQWRAVPVLRVLPVAWALVCQVVIVWMVWRG